MRTWLRFAAVSLTWGSSFLLMKLALEGMGAYQVAFGRSALGVATLMAVLLLRRSRVRWNTKLVLHSAVVALTLNVVPALLYAWAETQLSSGLASIYNATTPLMTLLVTVLALRGERIAAHQVGALLLGLAGVVVVAVPAATTGGSVWAHLACLGATACYGMAYVYIRRHLAHPGVDAVRQTALQLVLATVIFLPAMPFLGTGHIQWNAPVVAGILLLGIFGTGLCFVWNNHLIASWGPSRAAMTTYLTPVVGVLLGAGVLGEPLTWNLPAGLALVLVSIVLGRRHVGVDKTEQQPSRHETTPAKERAPV